MSVATVKAVTADFLARPGPAVLAIKGEWGVGKTYAWKKLIEELKASATPLTYSYVSLFGLMSMADLRMAVVAGQRPTKEIGEKLSVTNVLNDDAKSIGTRLGALLGSRFKDVPIAKNFTLALDAIAPFFIKNTIVCLDDFERLTTGKISPEEVLGFVSWLKEERNCKIVLIFNEAELGESAEIYRRYREKVVDIELVFAPICEEAAALAIPADAPFRDLVVAKVVALNIRNIRLQRKIVRLVTELAEQIATLHPNVMEQAVATIVLLAYCSYGSGKPTVDFLRQWSMLAWDIREAAKKGESMDPQKAQWAELLEGYGYLHTDEFDTALMSYIERGYLQESGVLEAAKVLDESHRKKEDEESFSKRWGLFHDTFASNEGELVNALKEGLRASARNISPINLNGTVGLLRELGQSPAADELIETYIAARANEPRVFALDGPFGKEIDDAVVRRRFAEQGVRLHKATTLAEAAARVAGSEGWSIDDLNVMAGASVEAYFKLFKSSEGPELARLVRRCLSFNSGPHAKVGENARAALLMIGKESNLNAIRVRRFGVDVQEQQDGDAAGAPQ